MADFPETKTNKGAKPSDSQHLSSKGLRARHVFHSGGPGYATDSNDENLEKLEPDVADDQVDVNAPPVGKARLNSTVALPCSPVLQRSALTNDQIVRGCGYESQASKWKQECSSRSDYHLPKASQSFTSGAASTYPKVLTLSDVPGVRQKPVSVPCKDSESSCTSSFFLDSKLMDELNQSVDSENQAPPLKENPYMVYHNLLWVSVRCEEKNCDNADCKQVR
ncbi:hypothetical protein ElyMa_002936300 [Elysia marginata]|uniref:Uncharacterized protein n=1 Tax=Elysia marginata TaxID=1093978 RepID=A0AAV4I4K5_9GAST|nr:hypothetical protein ElyMa_002936300 [Elysia marginata]